MNSRPLTISVVTPSFNQAKYVEQTMLSVLNQDYPHIEYLVLDGGSTDGSVDLIRKQAGRLAYSHSGKDGGQSDAIANGFARATGDILCWLNSDDVFLPGALRKVAEYFERHPTVEAVCGGAYIIDAEGRPVKRFGHCTLGVGAPFDRFLFYGQDGVYQQATFWRRSAYEAVGGLNRDLHFIMDRDLFARLARRQSFGTLPSLLACFRIHEECKTRCIPHVQRRESEAFFGRYGREQCSPMARSWNYWRFRLPSLARKARLFFLVQTGWLRLQPV